MPKPSLIRHGGWPFLLSAIVGRIPPAMIQLGLLMYVTGVGLGFGLGGLTVAAVGLGTALGSVFMGRLIDAFGPLPVIVVNTLIQAISLGAIHLMTPALVDGTLARGTLLIVAGVAGAANPQIGPIVRAHWSQIARSSAEPTLVRHALGYESALDEMSFIVGPILASLLVGLLGPSLALVVLIGAVVAGQGLFAWYLWWDRATWRAHRAQAHNATSMTRLPLTALLVPMVILFAVGTTFGATQTALNAVNMQRGTPELTGIIYGSVGVGSAITSVLTPRLPESISTKTRLLLGSLGLLLGGVAFSLLSHWGLGLIMIAVPLGFAIGVVLVTGFAAAEALAPPARIASTMTLMAMCLTLGVSVGAAVAGQLADSASIAFTPVVGAGLMAMVAVFFMRRGSARHQNAA